MSSLKDVTDASFDADVLKSTTPVVVDFWAEWCGPCRQIAPVLDELAAAHAGTLDFVKLNADDNPGTVGRYGVQGLPTLGVFVGGELVKTITGAKPKALLVRELSDWLG